MEEQKQFIPDYSRYTLGELEEIYSRMQKDKFLERVEAIENEIKKKKSELSKNPSLKNLENSQYNYEYAGFWKRASAAIIDGFIGLLFFPLTNYLFVLSFSSKNIMPILLYNVAFFIIIQYYLLTQYGGTPGHLIMQLRTINNSGNYLDYNHAFLRSLTYLPSTIFLLLQINHAINSIPSNINIQSILDITPALKEYGGIYTMLNTIFNFFVFIDIGTVLTNKKKRAIHDFIAGSYVVTNKSIKKIEEVKSNLIYT